MISYAPYMNSNHTYSSSISSVIVRNESSYKNPLISTQEVYASNRTPTILTVPAIKIDSNTEPKQAKSKAIYYSRSSSSVNTSQSKAHDSSQEPLYPGPLINTHGCYALFPPCHQSSNQQIDTISYPNMLVQRDTPPPAHLNAITNNLPKMAPATVPVNDFQTEPLDLVVINNNQTIDSNTLETNVPLQLYSGNSNAKPDSQETANKCDIDVHIKTEQLRNLKTSFLDNTVSPLMTKVANNVSNNSTIVPTHVSMTSMISSPTTTTISSTNLITNSTSIPSTNCKAVTTSKTTLLSISSETPISISAKTMFTTTSSTSVSTATTTTSSSVSITNLTTRNSSPPTPPPVLIPGPYTDMTCGIKTHHHKLKKAWLQRHVWAEDLKEAGVIIDQNPSNSFSPIDETPPILECEVTKKRKVSKSASENSVNLKMSSDLSPSDSDIELRPLNSVTQKSSKKRKTSNTTILSENKSATESDRDSDLVVEKKVPPIKIPKKRGRKPKVVVSIPLKKGKNDDDETRFFQSGPCLNVGPKIHKCRECRIFINKKKKDVTTQDEIDNIFCRFYAFRQFFMNKNGQLVNAGFPDPFRDVTVVNLQIHIFYIKYK